MRSSNRGRCGVCRTPSPARSRNWSQYLRARPRQSWRGFCSLSGLSSGRRKWRRMVPNLHHHAEAGQRRAAVCQRGIPAALSRPALTKILCRSAQCELHCLVSFGIGGSDFDFAIESLPKLVRRLTYLHNLLLLDRGFGPWRLGDFYRDWFFFFRFRCGESTPVYRTARSPDNK